MPNPEPKFPVLSPDDWRRSIIACRARKNAALAQIRAEVGLRKSKILNERLLMKQIVVVPVEEVRRALRSLKKFAKAERKMVKDRRQLGLCDGIIAACFRIEQQLPKS